MCDRTKPLERTRRLSRPGLIAALVLLAAQPSTATDTVVAFNEIMYHPAANESTMEWVELHNQMSVDVDMSGWSIRGGIEYDFPGGTIITGRGYLVVALSPSALAASSGYSGAHGPYLGRLANTGEELRLRNNNKRTMNAVAYRDGGDWPVAPDGSGVSLAKVYAQGSSESPENWGWSAEIGGTPAREAEHEYLLGNWSMPGTRRSRWAATNWSRPAR